ncbi:MAG: formate dehydrogenase accessory protein FdhE [Paracoccus denitrificans]|nr:MAG: formate dehydrogenase accessory protein FdhE [Paracoccus denitrificans]PZO85635.1 MAG: formate dehydrogenase accessory protein FdhE [Paracoccus denitrificans]
MTTDLKPDPSVIGGVATPPFALLPKPEKLFTARAERFDALAQGSNLAPYLTFLAALSRVQARLAADLPVVAGPDAERVAQSRAARMPPIDRHALIRDPAMRQTLNALCAAATDLEMPAPARLALDAVKAATDADRDWLLGNVLDDAIPADSAAPHLFAAAAVQVHLSRLAATLDAGQLVPIRVGVCPCCGGRPVASSITGVMGAEGARYALCAGCQTEWNEVRVKCLHCGSTKGIRYQAVEGGVIADDAGDTAAKPEPTIKAETCDECGSWVKQFYQNLNPTIEPLADDVASLGIDALMKDSAWRRAGVNPFTVGF